MKLSLPLKKCIVTQHFGQNPAMYKQFGILGHNGIDFDAPMGTPILAVADGVISEAKEDSGYGITIREIVQQDKKAEIVYGHLQKLLCKVGDVVKQGDTIGLTDNTGFSTGPHLHLGIRFLDGNNIIDYNNGYFGSVDPYPLFDNKISFMIYWEWKKLMNSSIPEYEKLPIDSKYGQIVNGDYEMMKILPYKSWNYLFERLKRFPTYTELVALTCGRWDYEAVFQNRIGKWFQYYTKDIYNYRVKNGLGM